MKQARVFIDGQAGTTGLALAERLALHPQIELLEVAGEARKDPAARARCMAAAEVTVLCLPDQAVPEALSLVDDQRLLDASSLHRTKAGWLYGLPELCADQRAGLRGARRVSNPGCYPQGFILLLKPLIDADWLSPGTALTVHAISGYSGGGRSLIDRYERPDGADPAPRPYALDQGHKHLPEMRTYSGLQQPPLFSPIVGAYRAGMLVHVPLHRRQFEAAFARSGDLRRRLEEFYQRHYENERLLKVLPLEEKDPRDAGFLDPQALSDLDVLQLMVFGDKEQVLLTARLDNLGKGAAGAAVQNLNLMLGFEETTALQLGDV